MISGSGIDTSSGQNSALASSLNNGADHSGSQLALVELFTVVSSVGNASRQDRSLAIELLNELHREYTDDRLPRSLARRVADVALSRPGLREKLPDSLRSVAQSSSTLTAATDSSSAHSGKSSLNGIVELLRRALAQGQEQLPLAKSCCRWFSQASPGLSLHCQGAGHLKLRIDKSRIPPNSLDALAPIKPMITRVALRDSHLNYLEVLQFIQKCPQVNMIDLDVEGATCSDLWKGHAVQLPGIKTLRLHGEHQLSIPLVLALAGACPYLEAIDAQDYSQVDLNEFAIMLRHVEGLRCVKLRGLDSLDDRALRELASPREFQQLEELDVSHVETISGSGLRTWLKKSPTLLMLNLFDCIGIKDRSIAEALAYGKRLQKLFLKGCPDIGDSTLKAAGKHCRGLEDLNINGCDKVTDAGLKALSSCCELKTVYMRRCRAVTAEGLSTLLSRCRKLERIDVTGCKLIDSRVSAALAEQYNVEIKT